MTAPAGTVYIGNWASDLMRYAGPKYMAQNNNVLFALVAWAWAEGRFGGWNPLDTTLDAPGAVSINRTGVKAYPTPIGGLVATWATLDNDRYAGVLAELKAGTSAVAIATAVAASPWGTEPFAPLCARVTADWMYYGFRLLTGPTADGLGLP